MQYFITFLVVLALASPVLSVCTTSDQRVKVYSDCSPPDSSIAFTPTDCSTADWVFYFDRTPGSGGSGKICIKIDCMDVNTCFRSSDYPADVSYTIGPYHDQEITDTEQGYLVIYNKGHCGKFANMDLRVSDFK